MIAFTLKRPRESGTMYILRGIEDRHLDNSTAR